MKHLIRNCKVIDNTSPYRNKRVDVLVERGKITEIGKDLDIKGAVEIRSKNLQMSIGWMDIGTHLGEPGYEQRETFLSLKHAAQAGGYTDLVTMPNSVPPIQSRTQIDGLVAAGKSIGIDIHPLGALSKGMKGEEITEFLDMHNAGAIGFSDGLSPVAKGGLLLRALQYGKSVNATILHHPNDTSLAHDDLVHEGEVSMQIGMKGSPAIAESMMTYRDLQLQSYAESRLCIHLISSAESAALIKKAKKKTQGISAGVSYLNLVMDHTITATFDTNIKVKPLLRAGKDKKALIKAVTEGTIDYISSNHVPLEVERKLVEYPYADHGAIGLETCFAAINSFASERLPVPDIIQKLTIGPRQVLGIDIPSIDVGSPAKITLFDPTLRWTYDKGSIKSNSSNTPFINQDFIGKVVATINGSEVFIA